MYTIRLTPPPFINRGNVAKKILKRFSAEAGPVIVDAIKSLLGTDALYQLQPNYAANKPKLPQYRAQAGKPADQPLILTGEMFNALDFHLDGDTILVGVTDGKAIAEDGDDYAEKWEQTTEFLEKGFALVEAKVGEILTTICCEEMGFTP